jgi:hypothetical protein
VNLFDGIKCRLALRSKKFKMVEGVKLRDERMANGYKTYETTPKMGKNQDLEELF